MAVPSRRISSAVGTYAAVSGSVRAAVNERVVEVGVPGVRTTAGCTSGAEVVCSMVSTLPLTLPLEATAERR